MRGPISWVKSLLAVPTADATTNTYSRDAVGTKTDAAVTAVATTKTIMAYVKGLMGFHTVPTADATTNAQARDVVGNKEDAAVVTVQTTKSLLGYIKGVLTYLLVASADATANTAAKDVLGNKTDVAVTTIGTTKSLVGYLKGCVALLLALSRQKGATWYVDSTISASGAGQSWATAWKTITEAVAAAAAGDTIMIRGSFTEAVTCSLAGVRFIGAGTNPNEAVWTAVADGVCLTLSGANCLVENIKFRPPARSAGTPAAISLGTGASYTVIRKNRFQGQATSYYAIYSAATGADNVVIEDNEFIYMNTATEGSAIYGVNTANAYSAWKIVRNIFNSCVRAIDLSARCCQITDNVLAEYGNNSSGAIAAVMTTGIHLDGAGSGANSVTRNQLGGTYNATLYKVGTAGDQWAGNFNVLTGGVTADNPA